MRRAISISLKLRSTLHIKLSKMPARTYLHGSLVTNSRSAKGNTTNMTSRWISQIGYTENEATVQLVFAPAVVPLITRLEEQFTKYDIEQISSLSVPMLCVCMSY